MNKKYWIIFIILTLSLGGLGGSFQLSRILLIIAFFANSKIKFINNLKYSTSVGTIICGFWIIYGSISLIWSVSPIIGLESELIVMSVGMLSLPVFNSVAKFENINNVIKYSWVGGAIIAVSMGIFEILTGNHFIYADQERILGGINIEVPFASGMFGNINNFCAYLVLCNPIVLWAFFEEIILVMKVFFISLIILIISLVILNGSRTGILVLSMQLVYFIIAYYRYIFKNFIVLLFLVILLVIYIPWEDLLLVINYRLGNTEQDARSVMITAAIKMLYISFGFGTGAGSFEEYAGKMNNFDQIINPHNLLLEIIAQYGVIVFIMFCFWMFHIFVRTLKNNNIAKGAKVAIQILILTIPLIGVMNSDALGYIYWWIIFASICTIVDS